MSTFNKIQNTIASATNNIANQTMIISNPNSSQRSIDNAIEALAFWTAELKKIKEMKPVNAQYPTPAPRRTGVNATYPTAPAKQQSEVNGWFTSFKKVQQDEELAAIDAENKRIADERIAAKAAAKREEAANHVYGLDHKTGEMHAPGAAAVYVINKAIVNPVTAAKRDFLLDRAQKGLSILDQELMDEVGEVVSLKQLFGTAIKQFKNENPGVAIPRYVMTITDQELEKLVERLDAGVKRECIRLDKPVVLATTAQILYALIRTAADME